MNVDDVKDDSFEVPAEDQILPAIFQHQLGLYKKYFEIERRNGFYKPEVEFGEYTDITDPQNAIPGLLVVTRPHIDDRHFQHWLKDMFWRTTEEIAEALEPLQDGAKVIRSDWQTNQQDDPDVHHFFEELADAVHFFVEASAVLQISPDMITREWNLALKNWMTLNWAEYRLIKAYSMDFIVALGLCGNCLKNKPWKLSHMATDEPYFNRRMIVAWKRLAALFATVYCDLPMVYRLYFKKNQVNRFRVRSNY